MKTLLYATGETHKLRPLSEHITSPMLPVLNRPVIDYATEVLARQDVRQIDISLLEKPGEIEAHLSDGKYRGLKLNYHLQREAWGDAGAVRWAFQQADEDALLIPADSLIDLGLEDLQAFHAAHAPCLTVVAAPAQKGVDYPASRRLAKGIQAPAAEKLGRLVSTGVFLISAELIAGIPLRTKVDLMEELVPQLLERGLLVYAYSFEGYWNPLDTFLQYYHAQFEICMCRNSKDMDGEEPGHCRYITLEGAQVSKGVWAGRNVAIHPSVQVAPWVYLNDNCMIDKDVQIGPDVVIGKSVIIDQGATVQDALILDHTYVGRLLNVQCKIVYKSLVIDFISGDHITLKDESLLAPTTSEPVNLGIRQAASVILALGLAAALSPFGLLIALLLALSGTGVLVKKEKSHTDLRWYSSFKEKGLRKFHLYQFQTRREDGSVSWLGKLLEAGQLHRIPELINVIKGDMALVGVKPLATKDVEQLTEDWQKVRFGEPAGITGLWYLQLSEDALFDQVLIADAYYTATRNMMGDLNILWQTPGAWWKQVSKNANAANNKVKPWTSKPTT